MELQPWELKRSELVREARGIAEKIKPQVTESDELLSPAQRLASLLAELERRSEPDASESASGSRLTLALTQLGQGLGLAAVHLWHELSLAAIHLWRDLTLTVIHLAPDLMLALVHLWRDLMLAARATISVLRETRRPQEEDLETRALSGSTHTDRS